jgi:hypothetical protein
MNDISPLPRDRRGRRTRPKQTIGNPGTLWRRIRGSRDNWSEMEKIGANPDLGTIPGKMYLHKIITASQASALRLYGEVVGRYDRFQSPDLRRTVASPAYQRGSKGEDGEVQRRIETGTIQQYERMANRARKAFNKLNGCIPTEEGRRLLEEIAINDREVESIYHRDIKVILDRIVSRFGIKTE